jgi:hypothetical protein
VIIIKSFYINGHILIHRKLLSWEWYDDISTCRLFIHLLITVNWYDEKWKGVLIKRGQRIASYKTLSEETKLSVRQVRTAIEHLKSTNEIAMNMTGSQSKKCSVITVLNYDLYQVNDKVKDTVTDNQATNQRQGNDKVTTQNKEDNKIIIKENNKYKEAPRASVLKNYYPLDEKLNVAFWDFIDFRKKIKSPMTDHAIDLLIKKLDRMTSDNDEKIEILNQSIMNSWKGVFPLKQDNGSSRQRQTQDDFVKNMEGWLDESKGICNHSGDY